MMTNKIGYVAMVGMVALVACDNGTTSDGSKDAATAAAQDVGEDQGGGAEADLSQADGLVSVDVQAGGETPDTLEGMEEDVAESQSQDTVDDDVPEQVEPTLVIGGERPAKVYLPNGYDPGKTWPLLVLLHGYSANGAVQNFYLGLSQRTMADGVILVVPEGTVDASGNQFWNATDYCCDFFGTGVDDVGYIGSLLDEAQTVYSVDSNRIYLMGHSNGAFMAYRMACEAADRIAGVVCIAGTTWANETKCVETGPVAVLHVHGTNDDTILYDGEFGYPGAQETVSRWVSRNGCSAMGQDGGTLDMDTNVDGAETTVTRWSECSQNTSVELWTMQGSSHIPAFPAAFVKDAVAFLLGHSL